MQQLPPLALPQAPPPECPPAQVHQPQPPLQSKENGEVVPEPSYFNVEQLHRRLEKVTRWRKWVNENPEDAEGNKELAKAEKKWAKELARCLAEGVQREEIQGVKEEDGNVKEEDPDVEVVPEEEEAQGSRDVVLVAEGVQQCWASERLVGVTGGGGEGSEGPVRLALQPSRPRWSSPSGPLLTAPESPGHTLRWCLHEARWRMSKELRWAWQDERTGELRLHRGTGLRPGKWV